MNIGTLSWLITVCIFGGLGWLLSLRRTRPAGPVTFVLLAGIAVVGFYLGVGTRLLDVFGFKVLFSWAIVSSCLGGIIGLVVRNGKLRRLEST